jgi:flavodoxin
MKYAIVYWSRFGNNKRLVDTLEPMLAKNGSVTVIKAGTPEAAKLPDADVYIFSAAAEKFSIQSDMKKLMKNLRGMEGKKYAIINTHALKFKNWLGRMDKLLKNSGMKKVAEAAFLMGPDTDKGKGLGAGWEKQLEEFAGNLNKR